MAWPLRWLYYLLATLRDFSSELHSLERVFCTATPKEIAPLLTTILGHLDEQDDVPILTLESNRTFSVKSFCQFLVDGGVRSLFYSHFWKVGCPSKITFLCWLAWDNKILTLTNLAKKDCSIQCAIDTFVLHHRCLESVDHLMLKCDFTDRIWHFFKHNLGLHLQSLGYLNPILTIPTSTFLGTPLKGHFLEFLARKI